MLAGLEAADLPADAIEVGRIIDAWGVQGWFKVLPYSADPQALFSSKRWFLLPPEQGGAHFSGTHKLAIRQARMHADVVVASARDVDDRGAAEMLRGARVCVPRSSFPSTQADEYYWVDLIGLDVINRAGEHLGVVRELLSTAAQTVLVIDGMQAGKVQERMIPFVAVYIDAVELAQRRIRVDWASDY